MALSIATIWEIRPTNGVDTYGGGFTPGTGTKTVNAATDLTIDATSNVKVTAGHSFVSGDVMKFINVTAGTGWTAGWYQIISAAGGAATLDHSPSAAGNSNKGTYNLFDGVDYSQQNANNTVGSNISTTDAVAVGTTTITSATGAFTVAISGNVVYFAGGTGSLIGGWYLVTYASSTSITIDRAIAAGTGITMNIGGALKTLSQASLSGYVLGNKFFMKSEATQQISAGITFSTGLNPPVVLEREFLDILR